MPPSSFQFVIAGQLKRDFALIPNGKALLDVPGGNLVYAATGFGVWEPTQPYGVDGTGWRGLSARMAE